MTDTTDVTGATGQPPADPRSNEERVRAAISPKPDAAPGSPLVAPRRDPHDVPKEPLRETIAPAVGPNPEGLMHQARLAHALAISPDAHAAVAAELETRTRDEPNVNTESTTIKTEG